MPSQNRRRNSTYNRQRQPGRRPRKKSVFSKVSFWIFICAVIIVIVLIVKGCDTGKIEADAPPSAESLAPPVVTESEETQNTSDMNNAPIPVMGNNAGVAGNNAGGTGNNAGGAGNNAGGAGNNAGGTGNNTGGTGAGSAGTNNAGNQAQNPATVRTPKDNYYNEYDLGAGNYVIGTDLPAGTVDFTAISGTGSISASNGTLSVPMFGNEEGYTPTVENMNLYSGAKLSVSGSLRMRVSYVSEPEELSKKPSQDENGKELSEGTYTSGKDFTAGTYDFSIVSGYGTVTSSNAKSGDGIDEMMGLADEGGNYSQNVKGISLPDGTTLTVEGCTVKIAKHN